MTLPSPGQEMELMLCESHALDCQDSLFPFLQQCVIVFLAITFNQTLSVPPSGRLTGNNSSQTMTNSPNQARFF